MALRSSYSLTAPPLQCETAHAHGTRVKHGESSTLALILSLAHSQGVSLSWLRVPIPATLSRSGFEVAEIACWANDRQLQDSLAGIARRSIVMAIQMAQQLTGSPPPRLPFLNSRRDGVIMAENASERASGVHTCSASLAHGNGVAMLCDAMACVCMWIPPTGMRCIQTSIQAVSINESITTSCHARNTRSSRVRERENVREDPDRQRSLLRCSGFLN